MNLGKAIKLFRQSRGLNQEQLSEMSDISCGYLSLLERNRRIPVFDTLQRIAEALDVPMFILVFFASPTQDHDVLDDHSKQYIMAYIVTELVDMED